MSQKAYFNYFRGIAQTHSKLLHNPASETGDAPMHSKRFTRFSPDEVITGLRSKLSFPALLVEPYEKIYAAANMYDIKSNCRGAFMVLASARQGNYKDEEDAYDEAEEIVEDILQKIWADHYGENAPECSTPFSRVQFANMQMIPVGPLFNNEFGWRIEFDFNTNEKIISTPPAEGVFINP
ncbi:MAG TPA: hypothetical protein PKY29_04375 [Ferruginibacter sp.]|nr:hypothetical protein [Ferruginibacter sp.]HRQ20524.1 hypothetical protein [Ferruginibacter sp.]